MVSSWPRSDLTVERKRQRTGMLAFEKVGPAQPSAAQDAPARRARKFTPHAPGHLFAPTPSAAVARGADRGGSIAALAVSVSGTGREPVTTPQGVQQPGPTGAATAAQSAPSPASAGETTARALCVTCHTLPPPNVLPRSVWLDEVSRMYLIAQGQTEPPGWTMNARAAVTLPQEWKAVADYYTAAAPERLKEPAPWPAPDGA